VVARQKNGPMGPWAHMAIWGFGNGARYDLM